MKKAMLATLLVMFVASWCLAQPDSIQTPTSEDTIKAKPVVAKVTDSPDKKWILGFEATTFDLEYLPGTVSLQRKISSKFFIGAGFHYHQTHFGPDEDYDYEDSTGHFTEEKQWTVNIKPEIGYMVLSGKPLAGGISIRLDLSRSRRTNNFRYWCDS